jgi:uncharacterized OB-fold protein
MNDKAKPIRPNITPVNKPFWDGCRRGELLIQRCTACGRLRYPAGPVCPTCLSVETQWQPVSGKGTVFSFIVFHRAYHPAWEGKTPYNVSLVELDEGPIMLSNVVGIAQDKMAVGLPVSVAFERVDDEVTLPVFEPV